MEKFTQEELKTIALASRLEEVRVTVERQLGPEYTETMAEYRPTIRQFIREKKLNAIGIASLIGEQIQKEGNNPLPFIAACIQFARDFPQEAQVSRIITQF